MKSLKFYLLIIGCALVSLAYAQESLVKISPFYFVDGTFQTSYEKVIKNDNSLSISAGYFSS